MEHRKTRTINVLRGGRDRNLGVVIPSRRHTLLRPLGEETALTLFKGYFNNKMTVILLRLQKRNAAPDALMSLKAGIFLDDLYHHMLKADLQKDYRRVFIWLKKFYNAYPNVKPSQRRKAYGYIKLLYEVFGLELKLQLIF